jgi:hypothetical protein
MLTTTITTFGSLAFLPGPSDECGEEFLHILKLQTDTPISHDVGVLIAYWLMQPMFELERYCISGPYCVRLF